MPETLQDSSPPTPAMTAQTPGTTPNSGDSIVALPLLSEQKGPISLTLTIDKSVGKVAAWIVGVMVGAILLSISALVIALSARDRADNTEDLANAKLDEARARYEDLATRFAIVERENRVTQERWNDLKVELAKRSIATSDH